MSTQFEVVLAHLVQTRKQAQEIAAMLEAMVSSATVKFIIRKIETEEEV